jgi:exopolyphosphatase/guanosine-5'-triphosphate,3'-diphosphate pyrophosphatase
MERAPVAIIDIGSNSVRLVVYSGATRIPSVIFNEKVMAGLGRGIGKDGALGDSAQERALGALARFRLLLGQMGVAWVKVVATAAVREASNGEAFLDRIRALGFQPRLLSGEEEGRLAGLGVLSAIPDADGVVGDLGGGSLELVEISGGQVRRSATLPFGVLKLEALAASGRGAFAKQVAKRVEAAGFGRAAQGRVFYMVGGSWRALARLDLALIGHPLPITHQHDMSPRRPAELRETLRRVGSEEVRSIAEISVSRVPSLPRAAHLLDNLVGALDPAALVTSSFGIREGLLYDELGKKERRSDPLIEAAREAGAGLGRFAPHGDLLDRWIAPVFDDRPQAARLRLAACLLSDIAWAAHPDFRAERGIDMALHGNWVAIDAPGRVMLAQALFFAFGGGRTLPYPAIGALCTEAELARAASWGLAMRLGQRLSGGVAAGLEGSRLVRKAGRLRLELDAENAALSTDIVRRRLESLAGALGLEPEIRLSRS